MDKYKSKFKKILFTKEQLINRIEELANEINKYYENKENILVVPIMDGSIVFAGHIIPMFNFDLNVRATKISSYYDSRKSNKNPKINISIDMSIVQDRTILILEDLIDKGHTLSMFKNYLIKLGAREVKICVLFNKQIKNIKSRQVIPDWSGFLIEDKWVAGFGVDSESKYRNVSFFGIVK